jgi:hypothetical protein
VFLSWRGSNLVGVRQDGEEKLIRRFYDSTTSRIIRYLMGCPGRIVTREEYDRGAPIGFRIGRDRYIRSFLSHSLPPAIFCAYFHARGDWAMYRPVIGEKDFPISGKFC